MSIHLPILRTCLTSARQVLMVDDRRAWRGAEVLVGALHLASEIERRCSTDTVGVMLPTSGAFPVAALAGWMLGRTVVPLNYLLREKELQYVIDDCGTDCVLSSKLLLHHLGFEPRAKNLVKLEDLSFEGVPELRWPRSARDEDLGLILYTSGTSGKPKGVMLSHGNITSNIAQAFEGVRFTSDDVLLGVLPQFHSFGLTVLTLLPLTKGCKVVYSARFVPQKILSLLREHRPTVFVGIPSMYNALLRSKSATPEDFSSLRLPVSGGEPLPREVGDRFQERFGVRIVEGYGLTETSPVASVCLPEEWRRGSVGRALPRVTIRIMDDGREQPRGSDGEIRLEGPNIMQGYYKLPEETASAFDKHGAFRTGDIGRLDPDGHLYITGRLKEMMIVGGENVFPREIEEVLNQHPSVADAGVTSKMDPVRGEVPIAFIEVAEEESFDETSILEHCRANLAGYKVPRKIHVVEALPRNPTGKIMRRALKDL